jgi:predicted MFS family arabinose efflux permease
MGKVMGAFSVAAVVGVPLGMQLTVWFSWHAPFVLIGGSGLLVSVLLAWWLPRGSIPRVSDKRLSLISVLVLPGVGFSYAMIVAALFSGFVLIPNLSTYFQFNLGYPRELIGSLYLLGGLASFFMLRVAGYLVDRFGSTPVGWFAWLAFSLIVLCAFIVDLGVALWLVFVIFMSANAVRNVAMQTLASKVPSADIRGAYLSLQSAMRHLATGFAAWISSVILVGGEGQPLQGFSTLAWMSIVVSLVVPVMMHLTQQRLKSRAAC